jgi:hypothetical protein
VPDPARAFRISPSHFDPKLKRDDVPEWDGDPDTFIKWCKSVMCLVFFFFFF